MASKSKPNRRMVVKRDDGWAVVAPGAKRASAKTRTQADGAKRARQIVRNLGGGEVTVQGRDGKFRDSDTVPKGNDPNPPRDRR